MIHIFKKPISIIKKLQVGYYVLFLPPHLKETKYRDLKKNYPFSQHFAIEAPQK
jgi:hypothetical protein